MQVTEFEKKAGFLGKNYALGVTLTPVDQKTLADELAGLQLAVEDWDRHRGRRGDHIQLTVVADEPMHDRFESGLEAMLAAGSPFRQLVKGRTLAVSVLYPGGRVAREADLTF